MHSDIDATAKVGEVLERLQPPSCLLREHTQRWCNEVTEGLSIATAHTSSHLMQVAQSEVVGTIDDDGVSIGDINTILHDSGGE